MGFFNNIRKADQQYSTKKQICVSIVILILGICLGTFSKFLDYRQAELPAPIMFIDEILDFHNFLGGFAPWIIIAIYISIKSYTPVCAGINVFVFFSGMVSSYYLYCNFVAGFFPKNYALIWIGFTIISPLLAFICWFAKGDGIISLVLSASIVSVLINIAFSYGIFYINISSLLNILMLILSIIILHKSVKETIFIIGLGAIFAILCNVFIPIHIW